MAGLAIIFMTGPVRAQDMSATDIAKKAEQASYYQGNDGRSYVSMTITDNQDRTRSRQLTILRKNMNNNGIGEQRFYVYFHGPSDVRDTTFLVWKYPDKADDRWLYLPALDLVNRIAAEDERSSFVGSDYFYEDVSGRSANEDTHEIDDVTDTYYVLKSTPKQAGLVEFDYYISYIHKDSFIPVQVEYYADGKKYRQYTANTVETIDGFPTVVKSTMKDLEDGGQTTLEYSQINYNIGLEKDIFTERYLRNPPRQYLSTE
jgi:hypothetical protein